MFSAWQNCICVLTKPRMHESSSYFKHLETFLNTEHRLMLIIIAFPKAALSCSEASLINSVNSPVLLSSSYKFWAGSHFKSYNNVSCSLLS